MKNLTLYLILTTFIANSQVGLQYIDSLVMDGYVLLAPNRDTNVYIIDNCGEVVHQWACAYQPGNSAYLLEDGSLLKTGKLDEASLSAGGRGGMIEKYNWNGDLLFSYRYNSDTVNQHHDIYPMENGNVLVLAWELKSREDAILNGRDTTLITDDELWPEHIIEIEPINDSVFNIVWEWHVWDHLVQDFDSTKLNFGEVNAHPELMDINYIRTGDAGADWLHANGIHYNASLDQIAISFRKTDEIWIIDHSTTSEEAATHEGGNSGMGGDILYRWGNPIVYGRGTEADQQLFGQHNVNWIASGEHEGKLIIFNNGSGRGYSSVDIIDPTWNGTSYTIEENLPFGPSEADWIYTATEPTDFFASFISGAHVTANDHVLICGGPNGHLFEVDLNKQKHWEYFNPITNNGPLDSQAPPQSNNLFRATKYPPDYPAFDNKTFIPQGPLELNPDTNYCSEALAVEVVSIQTDLLVENPVNDYLRFQLPNEEVLEVTIFDLSGKIIMHMESSNSSLFVGGLQSGMYLIDFRTGANNFRKKIIKL